MRPQRIDSRHRAMLQGRTAGRCRGLSLVELLVGVAVSLIVLMMATLVATRQLHDGRKLMLETQVQQDLRAAADIVVRELRRAGFSSGAAQAAWYRGTRGVTQSAYAAIETGTSELRFSYGVDNDNVVANNERFGFRLRNGAIEFQLGNENWQALTDAGALTIEALRIHEHTQTINLEALCPTPCGAAAACGPQQVVRHYTIDITAHAVSDREVRRSLRAVVRPRNDALRGTCAA